MGFKNNTEIVLHELNTVLDKIDSAVINQVIEIINGSDKVFFTALGRAGFMGKSFVMRLMHMGKEVYVVGETNTPNFEKDDVLIICSGSGETKQFIQIAEKAKSYGGKLIVFTATPKSTLADMSDCSIVIQAPSKKQDDSAFQSIQPMASLFEQGILLVGDSIVLTMMEHASNDMIATLFFEKMNIDPSRPNWEDRDRFVLSKGHVAPALYAALAERGYIPREDLLSLRKIDSYLQGHPDMKHTNGVDMSTGSLGQGLSVANGMAIAAKLDKKDYRVYVMLGDGEVQEGQIWEAAMSSAHYHLNNIVAFLDYNGLQIDGTNAEVMNIHPIDEKFKSFGWNVLYIDGHDTEEISKAVDQAKLETQRPTIIIAKTIKGKGVSFMENNGSWHGTAPKDEQVEQALAELRGEE